MTWLAALVLGMVQGLTEFLPISSTAHLRVVAAPAGWPNPGAAFTVVTQRGTESAVLLYFRVCEMQVIDAQPAPFWDKVPARFTLGAEAFALDSAELPPVRLRRLAAAARRRSSSGRTPARCAGWRTP